MCAAADIAVKMGIFDKHGSSLLKDLVKTYNLPESVPEDINVSDIINAMKIDKKVKAGRPRFILPESIGNVRIEEDVDGETIKEILSSGRS
jgi:3-dehydroquinate synthase